jgi:hypothetical protein
MYGAPQKHALMDAVFDALGVSDSTPYLMRPDSPEYQQKQMQAQQQEAEVRELQRQAGQMQIQLAQSKEQREWAKLEWQQTTDMDAATRELERLDHDKEIDNEKIALGWSELYHEMDMGAAKIAEQRRAARANG